jgi:hypothetical protein
MTTLLDAVTDLVAARGVDRARASMIAVYLADRCAGLSLTTVHSSSRSSLRRDVYLVTHLGLTPPQIGAWLALIRGTRAVRQRDGRLVGGYPGMIEVLATGVMEDCQLQRFQRLAQIAAHGHFAGACRPRETHVLRRSVTG